MLPEVKDYIRDKLNNIPIIDGTENGFKDIKIFKLKKHFPDGHLLKHSVGQVYGVALLNAFTTKSRDKIIGHLKSFPEIGLREFEKFVDDQRLFEYIHVNTKKYSAWKENDKGTVYLVYDSKNEDFKVESFANYTDRSQ